TDNEEFGGVTHTLTHKHMWSVKRIQTATWAVTRSEAIQTAASEIFWIASSRRVPRNDGGDVT
ncbi:hypothetical protein, partial [Bradyrhizobium sp. 197]|uniref:hypothetical protein n=1 Tax=Bradyrhizobium sp. 197 TaxID=2782663 RepID=UPI001FF9F287